MAPRYYAPENDPIDVFLKNREKRDAAWLDALDKIIKSLGEHPHKTHEQTKRIAEED